MTMQQVRALWPSRAASPCRALLYISKMQNGNLSEFAETYFTHLNAAYKGAGDADDRWISDCSYVRRK